jgi:hypothetical protein
MTEVASADRAVRPERLPPTPRAPPRSREPVPHGRRVHSSGPRLAGHCPNNPVAESFFGTIEADSSRPAPGRTRPRSDRPSSSTSRSSTAVARGTRASATSPPSSTRRTSATTLPERHDQPLCRAGATRVPSDRQVTRSGLRDSVRWPLWRGVRRVPCRIGSAARLALRTETELLRTSRSSDG